MSSRYGPTFPWSPEAIADLRRYKAEGLSSTQIAKLLSDTYKAPVSRSAVIGKCMRENIATPPKPVVARLRVASIRPPKPTELPKRTAKERVAKELVSQRRAADLIRFERDKVETVKQPTTPGIHPDLIATAPADIMGLRLDSCRWPLERTDEHGDTLYCCNTKTRGFYCEGHAQRAFTRQAVRTEAQIKADAIRRSSQIARIAAGNHGWSNGFSRRSA